MLILAVKSLRYALIRPCSEFLQRISSLMVHANMLNIALSCVLTWRINVVIFCLEEPSTMLCYVLFRNPLCLYYLQKFMLYPFLIEGKAA